MAWPANANNISTANVDSGTDNPASARADIKAAFDEITNIINGRAEASGVASLDSNSKIPSAQLPDEINSSASTNLTIDPATGIVLIEDIIQLNPITRSAAYAISSLADGMMAMLSDGDSTVTKPAYYAGGVWRYFDDNSEVPSS